MKSNQKRPEVGKISSDEQEDRLSSLPDSLLCHILSFLPTKFAALTSVLSKRWKYLFLGVPNIDLDESLVLKPLGKQVRGTNKNPNFINFVNRRLMLCMTSSITEFRLKYQTLPEGQVFNSWLTALLFRKIKILEVLELEYLYSYRSVCPPSAIFRSETLVDLKLCGDKIVLKMPEFVSLPNLKVLMFRHVDMELESDTFRLAEGYPVLEDLTLDQVIILKDKGRKAALVISMRTLKRLEIVSIEMVEYGLSRIDIDTPHLQQLVFAFWGNDSVLPEMHINLCGCESLVSADVSIEAYFEDGNEWFYKFLSKLNNIKELKLLDSDSQLFIDRADSLPQFPNLTHLDLLTASEKSMWNLLQRTPNLNAFVWHQLLQGLGLPESNENCFPHDEPRCFAQALREVTIHNGQQPAVIEVVRFFLQHGAVLERMIIALPRDTVKRALAMPPLLKLKRRSPECEIEII